MKHIKLMLRIDAEAIKEHSATKPIGMELPSGEGSCVNEAVSWLYDNLGPPGAIWDMHSTSALDETLFVFFIADASTRALEFKLRFGAKSCLTEHPC